jgi:hypothetical protein
MGGSPPGLFFRLIWLSRKGNSQKNYCLGHPKGANNVPREFSKNWQIAYEK